MRVIDNHKILSYDVHNLVFSLIDNEKKKKKTNFKDVYRKQA